MKYKEAQAATREALKPRVVGQHFGTNRVQRRRRFTDRAYTRPRGDEKADHVINDYRLQRIKWDGSNHERMKVREAFRAARKANNAS